MSLPSMLADSQLFLSLDMISLPAPRTDRIRTRCYILWSHVGIDVYFTFVGFGTSTTRDGLDPTSWRLGLRSYSTNDTVTSLDERFQQPRASVKAWGCHNDGLNAFTRPELARSYFIQALETDPYPHVTEHR